MNLFESFNNIVNDDFNTKIKSITTDGLGDSELAIKGIFHTLVAGLIRRCNSDMSSGMLFNQIQEKYKKSVLPVNFLDQLSDKTFLDKINNDGSKIISQIFPAYKSPLLSMISTYAGTSKNSTVLFSSITANILIDILGQKVNSEKFSKEDLVAFLRQHHEALFKDTPEILMDKMIPALGLQELTNMKFIPQKKSENSSKISEDESPSYTSNVEDEPTESSTFVNKKLILALIVIGILGAVGYYLYANSDKLSFLKGDTATVESVEEDLALEDSLNKPAVTDVAKTVNADSIANIAQPITNTGDEVLNMMTYVEDLAQPAGKIFDFKSIGYVGNTFELAPTAIPVIENLADQMLAKPALQIKIIAFDKTGNTMLNNKRAFSIKKVLIRKGVEAVRIDAGSGGVGAENPKIKVILK
jgi:outer membrane protein OmpA-like peptidoglycan-associated protein